MFHTILFLSYSIPSVYLFIRIRQLFIQKGHRLTYILIYAFLFSLYPVANLIDGRIGGILETITGYLLPFFLYLFLSVLVTDILLVINLAFKIIPSETTRKISFRNRWFIAIFCLSAIIVIAGIINFNTIRTTEYNLNIPGKHSDVNEMKIAFVSDFHLQEKTPVKFVERFVREIDKMKPDLMLYGGDMVEGDREDEKMGRFEYLLKGIKTRYGVYGVLGNHEHYVRQDQGGFFRKSGIEILSDTVLVFGHSFILAGRNDSHVSTRKSIDQLLGNVPENLPLILLDHRPTEIDLVSKTAVDIQLSGHTHHGQLFPINLITKKVYRLSYGHLGMGNSHFFVSSGIRLWGPPVRTAGKSEILVVNVTFTK